MLTHGQRNCHDCNLLSEEVYYGEAEEDVEGRREWYETMICGYYECFDGAEVGFCPDDPCPFYCSSYQDGDIHCMIYDVWNQSYCPLEDVEPDGGEAPS